MKEELIKAYRKIVPEEFRKRINPAIVDALWFLPGFKGKVKTKKSFGPMNLDKTFYVIRMEGEWHGLFSALSGVIDGIQYAEDHGYIPVVDFKNYYLKLIKVHLSDSKKMPGIIILSRLQLIAWMKYIIASM